MTEITHRSHLLRAASSLATALVLFSCSAAHVPSYAAGPAPAALNQTLITAKVLSATVVDSTTLKIQPQQPIVVLRLELLSVKQMGEGGFTGKPGDVITVYSKDQPAAGFNGKNVVATISFRGDERGGSLWTQEIAPQSTP